MLQTLSGPVIVLSGRIPVNEHLADLRPAGPLNENNSCLVALRLPKFVNAAPLQQTNPRCGTGTKPQLPHSPSHDRGQARAYPEDVAMAERPTSFAQQGILAPVELTKGKLIYVAKKDF